MIIICFLFVYFVRNSLHSTRCCFLFVLLAVCLSDFYAELFCKQCTLCLAALVTCSLTSLLACCCNAQDVVLDTRLDLIVFAFPMVFIFVCNFISFPISYTRTSTITSRCSIFSPMYVHTMNMFKSMKDPFYFIQHIYMYSNINLFSNYFNY